jgi:hypothetical protein
LLKLQKYHNDLNVFIQTMADSSAAIGVLLFVLCLYLVLLGSVLFIFEAGQWYAPTDECAPGVLCADYDEGPYPDGAYLR